MRAVWDLDRARVKVEGSSLSRKRHNKFAPAIIFRPTRCAASRPRNQRSRSCNGVGGSHRGRPAVRHLCVIRCVGRRGGVRMQGVAPDVGRHRRWASWVATGDTRSAYALSVSEGPPLARVRVDFATTNSRPKWQLNIGLLSCRTSWPTLSDGWRAGGRSPGGSVGGTVFVAFPAD